MGLFRRTVQQLFCDGIERFKVFLKGFPAAAGIIDHNAGRAQPDQRKAHCHAVILVGLHGRGGRHAGIDGDAVLDLLATDAHSAELGHGSLTVE